MRELSILIIVFLSGLGLARLFLQRTSPVLTAAAAFPLGLCVWVTTFIVVDVLRPRPLPDLPFSLATLRWTFGLFIGISIVLWCIRGRRGIPTLKTLVVYGAAILILGITYYASTRYLLIHFTPDSLAMLDITTKTVQYTLKAGYPIFIQCVQALSLLIGYDHFIHSIPQFVGVSLAAMMIYMTWQVLYPQVRPYSMKGHVLLACFAALPPLLLFSTQMGIVMLAYHNHHLIAAEILFLAAACFCEAHRQETFSLVYLGILCLFAFTLMRMEGLLMSAAIFPIFLSSYERFPEKQRAAGLLFLLVMFPWHLYVALSVSSGGAIVTMFQHLITLAFTLLAGGIFQINRWKRGQILLKYIGNISLFALVLMFVIFLWLSPQKMLLVLERYVTMMLRLWWGNVWFWLGCAALSLSCWRSRLRIAEGEKALVNAMWQAGTVMILLGVNINFFRSKHLEWLGSMLYSSNRMFMHSLPLILVATMIFFRKGFHRELQE